MTSFIMFTLRNDVQRLVVLLRGRRNPFEVMRFLLVMEQKFLKAAKQLYLLFYPERYGKETHRS